MTPSNPGQRIVIPALPSDRDDELVRRFQVTLNYLAGPSAFRCEPLRARESDVSRTLVCASGLSGLRQASPATRWLIRSRSARAPLRDRLGYRAGAPDAGRPRPGTGADAHIALGRERAPVAIRPIGPPLVVLPHPHGIAAVCPDSASDALLLVVEVGPAGVTWGELDEQSPIGVGSDCWLTGGKVARDAGDLSITAEIGDVIAETRGDLAWLAIVKPTAEGALIRIEHQASTTGALRRLRLPSRNPRRPWG